MAAAADLHSVWGISIELEQLYPAIWTPSQVEAAKGEVFGKPDHPKRREIAVQERRLAGGPDRRIWRIWAKEPGAWRLNETSIQPLFFPYVDRACRRGAAWQLNGDSLVIVKADAAPSGRDFAGFEGSVRGFLGLLLYGGMEFGWMGSRRLSGFVLDGDRWTFEMAVDEKYGARFEGSWNLALDRGFVMRRTVTASPLAGRVGGRHEFAGWKQDPASGRWAASEVEFRDAEGTNTESIRLLSFSAFQPGEFDRLTAIPASGSVDPAL